MCDADTLRLVLSEHVGIPHESQPDLLTEAEQVFAPKKPKAIKRRAKAPKKEKEATGKASRKRKRRTRKPPNVIPLWPRIRPGPFCLWA